MLAAATPLLLVAQALYYYSIAKPSTIWINNDVFFEGSDSRNISTRTVPYSDFELWINLGFYCVSSISPCDKFLFALTIEDGMDPDSQRIVWSANRDRPVTENATLEFTTDGNLVLRDADGSHVWSSNSSGRSVAGMGITDIGNLVLFDHKKATVWQSFDHPTNTLVLGQSRIQGMRLTAASISATNTTRSQLYITVWPDGLYAFVESTPPQCYFSYPIMQNKTGHYPTKVTFMNGSLTTFVQPRRPGLVSNISLPAAISTTQYLRLDSEGYLRLYEWSWSNSQSEWSWTMVYDVLSMQMDVCDYPTVCGEYGICTEGQCGCPLENNSSPGYFKLVDERKPNLGCAPINPISCQDIRYHRLLTLPNISYFDGSHTAVNATSIDDRKQACLKNYSCMAVLFRYNWNAPRGECLWVTKVFSLKSLQPYTGYNSSASNYTTYNSSAYIKVQLSPSNENKTKVQPDPSNENKAKVMLGATLGAVTALVLVVIVVGLYLQRRRKHEEKDEEFDFDQLPGIPTRYSFEKLRECTEGFSKKLGEGGFGSVFEGKLGENKVAVKRLEGARQGKKEFLAEVETIGSIEHINLVRLIGFCVKKSERLLVYEYMSRG